jgi:CRP/FNR family cyclic AMP-dependent transcriptional regulator
MAVGQVIFSEGDVADAIMYVQQGTVKVSAFSKARPRREAVVALPRAGDFFGEACLVGQSVRTAQASAITRVAVLAIEKTDMARMLRAERAVFQCFFDYMLRRQRRIEDDLIDQLLGSAEQRLARTLLILAGYSARARWPKKVLPRISQSTLAGMVGTSRARVNCLLKGFNRQGFIETDPILTVHRSLRRVAVDARLIRESIRE